MGSRPTLQLVRDVPTGADPSGFPRVRPMGKTLICVDLFYGNVAVGAVCLAIPTAPRADSDSSIPPTPSRPASPIRSRGNLSTSE